MQSKRGRGLTWKMVLFELRNTTGNPYVHIFGVGLPIFMVTLITYAIGTEIGDTSILSSVVTTVFLGMGPIIPLATVLMGYGASKAQEMEKNIPERMELFGIKTKASLCNRAVSELIFMMFAFGIYFVYGFLFLRIEKPTLSGLLIYILCVIALCVVCFGVSHAIATIFKKFGIVYCICMLLYFVIMFLSGMMGVDFDSLPEAGKVVAKLLPTTYINQDFYTVWSGEKYNFVPLLQAYLFVAAIAGILVFITVKKRSRKLH